MGASPKPSLADRERAALSELLEAVGPDAPTLCEGWTTRDLVAHLVLRESHPSAAGLALPALSGWTERKRRALADHPYGSLVARFREGPPLISPFRLPKAQELANTFEHVVHHEDVRRAEPGWSPRVMSDDDQLTLWSQLRGRHRLFLRDAPVSVRLVAPDVGELEVSKSNDTVTLTGAPAELVIYLHGRRDRAQVVVSGSDAARQAWLSHTLRV